MRKLIKNGEIRTRDIKHKERDMNFLDADP